MTIPSLRLCQTDRPERSSHAALAAPAAATRLAALAVTVAAMLLAALALLTTFAATAHAHTVLRGICEFSALDPDPTVRARVIAEDAQRLRAKVIRISVSWPQAEPAQGVYDEAYLTRVADAVGLARAQGLKAVVMTVYVPEWASDRSFWDSPPGGHSADTYYPFYPMRADCLDDFGRFGRTLAGRLRGKVLAYTCWCEPNLWCYLYPQRTASDDAFAPHWYVKMLKQFYGGVKAGDPAALVVGGVTSPVGDNNRDRTSPQRFARVLKASGAAAYFDVYGHHPYAPGGSKRLNPEAAPTTPSTTVTLGNLGTLLQIFPSKPFYLTEYGYNTQFSWAFGGAVVSEARQAEYLRRAYRRAARFPQVKMLLWYLRQDSVPAGENASRGVYCGLRTISGGAKRAYYSFAGGNRLTVIAATRVRAGARLTIHGRLTSASIGPLAGIGLAVQMRRSGTRWNAIGAARSDAAGYYRLRLAPRHTASYRVKFAGVVTSARRTVRVY